MLVGMTDHATSRRSLLACVIVLLFVPLGVSEVSDFGLTSGGVMTHAHTLTNANGMSIRLLDLGATLMAVEVPDREGNLADVVLGFDQVDSYESDDNQ
ncbi:MAG: hypothetical protein AAF266_16245, partial [Planctomycetota bacterium]